MTQGYSASLLLAAGVCLGFAMHAASLALGSRQRQYLDLLAISLLQTAYCGVTHLYFRESTPAAALPYGQWICIVTPYLTYFFGQLTLDLLDEDLHWLRRLQRWNLLLTTLFVALVFSDWAWGTHLALTGELITQLDSRHRHRLFFTGLGHAYLLWVSTAFSIFAYVLFRRFRSRPDLRPMMFGCVAYFAATTADFGILVGLYDSYFLQHFGFFVLVGSCWRVVAARYDRKVGQLRTLVRDLQEQRRRLLRSPDLVQQQKLNALGTLAAGVAHEVNNPLQGILGCADLLCERLPSGTPNHTLAARVVEESARVSETVRGLLRFSRQEDEDDSLIDLVDLIADVRMLFQTVLDRDGVTFHVDIEAPLPPVRGRPRQLSQVLMNLLTNARDAVNARDDGVTREIRLHARTETDGDGPRVVVTVRDNGVGVTPACAEHIFDPFYTTKKVGEGTGLGLSISHGIVAAHGGHLEHVKATGMGACFRFDLPAGPGSSVSSVPPAPRRARAS